jgi:hypothetical protein
MDNDAESTVMMDASPLSLALKVHADQARTGARLGLIETRLQGLEDQAQKQTTILAELAAAIQPLSESIRNLAAIQAAELEQQRLKFAWEQQGPERTRVSAGIAIEVLKAGGVALLALGTAIGAAWAALWRQ